MPVHEVDAFFSICSTVGGYIVFPSNKINKSPTINGACGLHGKVRDRFDLTLKYIRRHYQGQDSPLSETLSRYDRFFRLFGNFDGYVEFFFLEDMMSIDNTVRFFLPFRDFHAHPLPRNLDEYRLYKDALVAFIVARNQRIAGYASLNSPMRKQP